MVILHMEEPKVIVQAPPSVKKWGYCQFPLLYARRDGNIHLTYQMSDDSAAAYGSERAHAVYDIATGTWTTLDTTSAREPYGYRMPNGDFIRPIILPSVDPATVDLPKPFVRKRGTYEIHPTNHYLPDDIPEEYGGWHYQKLRKGSDEWTLEQVCANIPGLLRRTWGDVLSRPRFEKVCVLPGGKVLMYGYEPLRHEEYQMMYGGIYVSSEDSGQTWRFHSKIEYDPDPDPQSDPLFFRRDGFHEPATTVLPDGSLFSIMRTETDLPGPVYQTRSTDGGLTWGKQTVFDSLGVWPQLLTLGNGVTIATFGRPGLYMRATDQADGSGFGERAVIVEQRERGNDKTCAYSSMQPLTDNTFLLAYSKFDMPNGDDIPCKTILSRVVRTEITKNQS